MSFSRVAVSLVATLSAIAAGLIPGPAYAGDIVLPVHSGGTVNSWFDHDGIFNCLYSCSPSDNMIRYDGATWPNSQAGLSPCQLTVNCYDGHDGIDFVASYEPVYAVSDGTVTFADRQTEPGNEIKIYHPLLGYSSYYAHLDSFQPGIVAGSRVAKGQPIATSGCSGTGCSGAHLHFAVYDGSGRQIDPFGWSGNGNDPYTADQGYLWATRFGVTDGTNLYVGDPYLTSSPLLTEWNGGVNQSIIWGPRIGVLYNGSLSVKDGSLGAGWLQIATSVSTFAMAGRRVVAEFTDGTVYVKEGDLGAGWQREADLDGASTLYAAPTRIGALVGSTLKAKDGLSDSATSVASPVANASLAKQRIAVTFTDGSVYYKDGGLGATWSAPLASGADSVYLGGNRICTMYPSLRHFIVKCQEAAPFSSTWTTIYNTANCVQVNDVRIAICDSSTGYKRAAEGPIGSLSSWVTESTSATSILLN